MNDITIWRSIITFLYVILGIYAIDKYHKIDKDLKSYYKDLENFKK